MKSYPSIENSSRAPREHCLAFVKYDGSNIRAEWSKKRGWYKFGTRKLLINETSPYYGPVIPLFKEKYGEGLDRVFRTHRFFRGIDSVVAFGEWFGRRSFAGQHKEWDQKDIVLFDVSPLRKGILEPRQFLDLFGHLPVAELVHEGILDDDLIEAVRESDYSKVDFRSKYPIATRVPEGVICKGGAGHDLWMTKIKTREYLRELKAERPDDWEQFWE